MTELLHKENKIYEMKGRNEDIMTLWLLCNDKKKAEDIGRFLWEDRRIGETIEHDVTDYCTYENNNGELVSIPFTTLIKKARLKLTDDFNKPVRIFYKYE